MWLRAAGAAAAAGAACVAYGVLVEHEWFRLGHYRLEILPAGSEVLSVLHVSDLHFLARDDRKARFLADLRRPDVAVATGDLVGEPEAVERVVAALRPVRGRLGSYFVLGSNDYFAPRPVNYLRYFRKYRGQRKGARRGRSRELVAALEADGWTHLKNIRRDVSLDGTWVELVGLDDSHIHRGDLRSAPRRHPRRFGLAVTHSPDPAPELAALGYDLVVAGHTHGGQVRLPLVGALVTNSHMPRSLSRGLLRLGPAYVHISPGMGTSKYAPFRFLCRPEATLLELSPKASRVEPIDSGIGRANGHRDVAQLGSAQRSGR
jgi:predicted MPP superfamily phosphohydrolase